MYLQHKGSLDGFNAQGASLACERALRKMGDLYNGLPDVFASAMVSNHASKASLSYIEKVIEREKFTPENRIEFSFE